MYITASPAGRLSAVTEAFYQGPKQHLHVMYAHFDVTTPKENHQTCCCSAMLLIAIDSRILFAPLNYVVASVSLYPSILSDLGRTIF